MRSASPSALISLSFFGVALRGGRLSSDHGLSVSSFVCLVSEAGLLLHLQADLGERGASQQAAAPTAEAIESPRAAGRRAPQHGGLGPGSMLLSSLPTASDPCSHSPRAPPPPRATHARTLLACSLVGPRHAEEPDSRASRGWAFDGRGHVPGQ